MKSNRSVALAAWMMEHLTFGPANQSLTGDLLEEFQLGRSLLWFWGQVLATITIGSFRTAREFAMPVAFSAGWSMLYPAWRMIDTRHILDARPEHWHALAWPYSALLELGFGIVPAVTFVWLGFLVYLVLRADLFHVVYTFQLIRSLSTSLTALLLGTALLLNHFRDPQIDLHYIGRQDFYSAFHLFTISIPLALSLLAALLCTPPHTIRPGRRQRLGRRPFAKRVIRLIQTLCLTLSLSPLSAAQAPQTYAPASQQLAKWLAAFDGNDRETYYEFLEKNLPSRAEHFDREWEFRSRTGGFDLQKIEEDTPTKLTALLRERNSDQLARVVLEVDAAEPHRILKMDLNPVAPSHLSENDLIAGLRRHLDESADGGRFAGAVLVARDGKPIFAQAYGLADRERKIPNTLNTRFRIGSMNKMFTAVAVLQLAQAGKLKLDDPLGKYLIDYPNKELASKVTISELLDHTGGTGDIFGPEFDKHRLELRTHQDYVKLYGNRGLSFEPGSRWEYSNYGFVLLGNVIERVTGQSYYDYVREHVYQPAGMSSTGSQPEDQSVPDRSVGYTEMGASDWHSNVGSLPYRGTSAGGGYSTVRDLLAFAKALRSDKLLDVHYTELLTTGRVDTPNGGRYAYGFFDRSPNGSRCVGHSGGSPGMNGDLEICQDARYIFVVLANMDPPAAQEIGGFIAGRLPAPGHD